MKKRRNIIIGFVAVAMILSGVILLPKTAAAEEIVVDEIVYDNSYEMAKYWTADGTKTAPVKTGYIFGGWYKKTGEKTFEALTASSTEAYAKFVPDYVLSVRAQNEEGTSATDNKASSTRVLSSVDSADYLNVGFDIYLANKKQLTNGDGSAPLKTTKAYSNIMVGEDEVSATETFGAAAKYFVVWRLDNIANENDGKIIYVRPYWTTKDGTTVYGLAKYVHVEDEYKGYISVPVNLMTGEPVAAGVVKMTYQTDLEFVGFEAGRVLPVMAESHATDGIIKMVGNVEEITDTPNADGIYANIRFVKPSTDPNKLTFGLSEEADFADWDEEEVKITPVIQY